MYDIKSVDSSLVEIDSKLSHIIGIPLFVFTLNDFTSGLMSAIRESIFEEIEDELGEDIWYV